MATIAEVSRNNFVRNGLVPIHRNDPPQHNAITAPSNIPLINSLVTDEDLGLAPGANLDPEKLQTAVELLTCQHAKLLKRRHMKILQKLISIYQFGFPLDSLVSVLTILNACAEFVPDDLDYEPVMVSLISLLRHPFIMFQSSDEVSFRGIVTDTFAQIGYLLRVDSVEIRQCLIDTLCLLYTEKSSLVDPDKETKRVSSQFIKRAIEESAVSETVMKALALIEVDQIELRNSFFTFLQSASFSKLNANFMLRAGAAYILCVSLMDNLHDYKLVQQTTEIIWNLIEFGEEGAIIEQLSNLQCLQALHKLFLSELSQSHSAYHRTVRNDVTAIITLVAKAKPEGPLIEAGIVKTCLQAFSCEETKTRNVLLKHMKLHNNSEDFEFKKHLLALILCFAKNHSCLNLFRETRLFQALFYYVRPIRKIESCFDLSRLEEIQLQSLSTLCNLTVGCAELTTNVDYGRSIMSFFDWCLDDQSDPYLSQGNSFYSSGGRHSKKSQLRYALRYIRCIVKASNEEMMQLMVELEMVLKVLLLINDLIKELENPRVDLNPVTDKEDERETLCLELACESLFILSIFCEQFSDHKELLSKDGISLFVHILNIDPDRVCRGLGHNKLILAVAEAIWSCVVGSFTNEKYFLESSGVFAVLDLIETTPRYLQTILLGCLLDLMENSLTLPHVLTWENKQQVKASKLMIKLWKETEQSLKISRGDSGVIQNISDPLKSVSEISGESDVLAIAIDSSKTPTKRVVEVSENLRAKIYSFFLKIPQDDLEGLAPSDHIWLALIEKYLDFKSAEIWTEMTKEFTKGPVRPTTPDLEVLESITRISAEKVGSVVSQQMELQESIENQETTEEQMFYGQMRSTMRQQEKLVDDFEAYVKRTSNFEVLRTSKRDQLQSIEASRGSGTNYTKEKNFHATAIGGNLNTTVFSGKHVHADHVFHQETVGTTPIKPTMTATSSRREARFSAD